MIISRKKSITKPYQTIKMASAKLNALEVTEKNHWSNHHPSAGYTKWMSVIDQNIVHTWIEAKAEVVLDFMDVELLQVVLTESALENQQFHILFDLHHVLNITFKYKQAITDLFFNWSPILGVIGFYNISESMRITVETFAAVAPQKISVILSESYEGAVGYIIAYKESNNTTDDIIQEHIEETTLTTQFLQAIARISWLNMLDEPITTPPPAHKYYPFFKAMDSLRIDLITKEREKERELQLLQQSFEHRITQMVIKMNAQAEANKKFARDTEKEMALLKKRVDAQEGELTRRSTTHRENTKGLQELLDQIYSLEISPLIKKNMTDCCSRLIENDSIEKKLSMELTESDSLFISLLQKKFPQLNKRELRICLLVKLNFDTADIAHSIGLSTRGIETIRYRLHKKLGLGKHQSIKTYLTELAMT